MDTWNTPPGEVPQGICSGSTTLTTCNGKINSDGVCIKCFQVSQTSSSYCTRLIEETKSSDPLPEDISNELKNITDKSGSVIIAKHVVDRYVKKYKDLQEEIKAANEVIELSMASEDRLRSENERLKLLLEQTYKYYQIEEVEESWQQFKTENNL